MAAIYETAQVGKRQEISDAVFNVRADETPFTSMVPKDKKPVQKLASWQSESYRNPSLDGVMDGADVEEFNGEPRVLLEGYAHHFREPWKVTTFADLTEVAGVPEGEVAHQEAIATKVLKFGMEGRSLSALEMAVDNGTDTPNKMRGALLWLATAAQSVKPVDPSFRPSSEYTGAIASFTEAQFKALLTAAMKETKAKLKLTGIVGIDCQNVMDDWTARDPAVSSSIAAVRSFTMPAEGRQLINVVTQFTFSAGQVTTHTSTYIALDAAGAPTAYTYKSGIFVDLRMWALGFMKRPGKERLPNMGGGPRGFADAVMVLKCRNPLGQRRIYTAT